MSYHIDFDVKIASRMGWRKTPHGFPDHKKSPKTKRNPVLFYHFPSHCAWAPSKLEMTSHSIQHALAIHRRYFCVYRMRTCAECSAELVVRMCPRFTCVYAACHPTIQPYNGDCDGDDDALLAGTCLAKLLCICSRRGSTALLLQALHHIRNTMMTMTMTRPTVCDVAYIFVLTRSAHNVQCAVCSVHVCTGTYFGRQNIFAVH